LATYDLQDPTDLDIMRGHFDMHTSDDWQHYIELAEEKGMKYKNVNILKTAQRKAGIGKFLSPKVINWILSLVEELEEYEEGYEEEE